jgi:DUF218 domain
MTVGIDTNKHYRAKMIFRDLILSAVLLTNVFANPAFRLSGFHRPLEILTNRAVAQNASGFDPAYRLSLSNPVQDKNFYLLSLFQRNRQVRRLLTTDEILKPLSSDKLLALKKAGNCKTTACFDELIRFDSANIEAVAAELQRLGDAPEFKLLAEKDLRPSGVFIKYSRQSDKEMLVAAWRDAAAGMNRLLSVYCVGRDPRYKEIDKVSFNVSTEDYRNLLTAGIRQISLSKDPLFFEPTLNFALKLLEINRRDEAARYEPLERGQNKAAVQSLKNIKWSDYQYSFILVLGSGPADSARLSPIGAKRADVGAQLFLQHKAPLIILSGGHVHPMQTPYCEAIEMKKYVMEKYKIPETSILVDPHARHTTTNLRNAARLAFRYRMPAALALVTSSESHIVSTTSDEFRTRCLNELGYFPAEFIRQISPVEAEFKPSVASLFFDSSDPLDP